jgi:hypothetical protein
MSHIWRITLEIERDAVAAEDVACHPAHFARLGAAVVLGELNLSSPTCRGVSARRFDSATSTTAGHAFSISYTRRGSSSTPPKITARTSG